ncbi:MAG: DUF2723 domain-containing protein [Candidatus Tectomicrobia bacterium]|uniref:DUF2723 domain-containing protein n=1 Tax=Tectimicrobiota bacterium TaxID=2528274 RepID=A0A932CL34_UNCTE|nr:DUF2723 domain-containing protein [Candidatus Tectomicrobia bacterium]
MAVLLLFIATFSVYLLTLAPTLPLADSPELVATAFTLGVAHPPGYGLYSLVGKLVSFLPLGTVAWRLNVMSALLTSLAGGTFYLALCRLRSRGGGGSPAPGIPAGVAPFVMALILAFSPSFWASAVGAEVYPLHLLLFVLLVWSTLGSPSAVRLLCLSLFLSGLWIASHTANGVYLAALSPLLIGCLVRSGGAWRGVLPPLLFFLLGLSVVTYLPVRSAISPWINQGEISGWGDLYRILTGRVYLEGLPHFAISRGERWFNMRYALLSLGHEFGWGLGLFGLLGAGMVGRHSPRLLLSLLLVAGFGLTFFGSADLGASGGGHLPFPSHLFLPCYVAMALLIGAGLQEAVGWLGRRKALRPGLKLALLSGLFLLPLSFLLGHYRASDHSGSYWYHERGKKLLGALEDGATLLCSNRENLLFFFWYFRTVEGRWQEVTPLIINPFLANPVERLWRDPQNREAWERLKGQVFRSRREQQRSILEALIQAHIDRGPLYTNLPERYIQGRYVKIPRGGVYRIQRGLDLKEVLAEGPWMGERVGVRYGGALELLGVDLDRQAVQTGDHFRITYFWRAFQELKKDYQVMVRITDKKGEVVRMAFAPSLSHAPVYGALPTSRWPRKRVIKEAYELVSSSERLEAGEYGIHVGVGDGKELLPVTGSQVPVEGRFARIGRFEVLP